MQVLRTESAHRAGRRRVISIITETHALKRHTFAR
jgi:hypothetical protein